MSKGVTQPRVQAMTMIGPFFRYMEQHRGIGRVEFAGSIRREKSIVGDIDITATLNGKVSVDRIWDDFVKDQGLTYIKSGDFERTIFLGHNVEVRFLDLQNMTAGFPVSNGWFWQTRDFTDMIKPKVRIPRVRWQ